MVGEGWLVVTGALLLASLFWRDGLLFLIALTLLGAAAITRLWQRRCLDAVEYRRELSHRRAWFGEEIELTVEVVNRKLLPLAWLEAQDEIPRALQPTKATVGYSYKPGRSLLTNVWSLRWYERVRRRFRVTCSARGEFAFGPAVLRSGDVFGFETREQLVPAEERLLVYPRIVPVTRLGLPAQDPIGDRRVRDWLFEDPANTVGIREYQPGDHPRRVHWGATARMGALQVKLYQPTTEPRLVVFLNIETLGVGWWRGYDPELLELAITIAASVAAWAVEDGRQVGLHSNATLIRTAGSIAIEPGRSQDQLAQILEALARAMPLAAMPFHSLLRGARRTLQYGATLVVVTPILDDESAAELMALRRAGHRIVLLLVGQGRSKIGLAGIAVYTIASPLDAIATA